MIKYNQIVWIKDI